MQIAGSLTHFSLFLSCVTNECNCFPCAANFLWLSLFFVDGGWESPSILPSALSCCEIWITRCTAGSGKRRRKPKRKEWSRKEKLYQSRINTCFVCSAKPRIYCVCLQAFCVRKFCELDQVMSASAFGPSFPGLTQQNFHQRRLNAKLWSAKIMWKGKCSGPGSQAAFRLH